MSYAFQQCKSFENRLRFDKIRYSVDTGLAYAAQQIIHRDSPDGATKLPTGKRSLLDCYHDYLAIPSEKCQVLHAMCLSVRTLCTVLWTHIFTLGELNYSASD